MKVTEYSKMAKTRKSSKKEKKRTSSKNIIAGLVVIIALLVVLALLVWLIMPMAGKRSVPRKFRGLQQSRLEYPLNRLQMAVKTGEIDPQISQMIADSRDSVVLSCLVGGYESLNNTEHQTSEEFRTMPGDHNE